MKEYANEDVTENKNKKENIENKVRKRNIIKRKEESNINEINKKNNIYIYESDDLENNKENINNNVN